MPRADIYRLQHSADGGIQFACRLTEKAFLQGYTVRLRAPDRDSAAALDRALWEFRRSSFVPHALAGSAQARDCPVCIDSVDGQAKAGDSAEDEAKARQPEEDRAQDSAPDDAGGTDNGKQGARRLLVLLAPLQGAAPEYERIAEILVAGSEAQTARRLEFYSELGYETHTHEISAPHEG